MFTDSFEKLKLDKLTNGVRLPEINTKHSYSSNYDYLSSLAQEGFKNKLKDLSREDAIRYKNRAKEELYVLKKLNLVDYILLIYDFIQFCKKEDIPVGAGRGSVTGSLVCYLIGITGVNPLTYKLSFTRFISEARAQSKVIDGITYLNGATMPDVDTDISNTRRGEVLNYISNKYEGKTAKISNNIHLTGKVLIKVCAKSILKYSEPQAKYLSDMVDKAFGKVEKISSTYENNDRFKEWANESDENKFCYDAAVKLEDVFSHKGQHASGVVVSYYELDSIAPLQMLVNTKGEQSLVTSFDMKDIANILVKVDILGLKTADLIKNTLDLVGLKEDDININDPSIYNFLNNSDNFHGFFQIESGLGKDTILKIKPKNIEQLSVCIAVGRPGSMKFIPDLVKYTNTGEVKKIYEPIDDILIETGGNLIYQEQITRICEEVYGMSDIDADSVRFCIGKKLKDKMKEWEEVIYKAGETLNVPKDVTDYFWDTCNRSADYLFSKNHSLPYSSACALTVYLKANHPLEFYLCLLQMAKNDSDSLEQISIISKEMKNMGFELLPPSILASENDFYIDAQANGIRYGLSAIKSFGQAAQDKIMVFNKDNKTKFDLFNSCYNSKLGLRTIAPLIMSGCLPDYGVTRAKLLLEYQTFNILTDRERSLFLKSGEKFNYELFPLIKHLSTAKDDKGKVFIKESRLATIRKDYDGYKKIYEFNSEHSALTEYLLEKENLGFAYSNSLSSLFKDKFKEIISINHLANLENKDHATFVGTIVSLEQRIAKTKSVPYVKLVVEDDYGVVDVIVYGEKTNQLRDDKEKFVEEGSIIVVTGSKSGTGFFANYCYPQWDMVAAKRMADLIKK